MNESSVPESEARDKKPGSLNLATYAAALGVFGAVVGGVLTWAFDLGLVWQAKGAFLGALLMGGFCATYLMLVFRVTRRPKDGSLVKRSLRAPVSVIFLIPILAALVGGVIGAVDPNGGVVLSVYMGGVMAAITLAAVLGGFAIAAIYAVVPRPVRVTVSWTLLGCVLGTDLWRAWFGVGWLNLGAPIGGILMAALVLLVLLIHAQKSKDTKRR